MLACVDVDYRSDRSVAACVLFRQWADDVAAGELVHFIDGVEPYQPGQFYKRELPCLLGVLRQVAEPLTAVVVDGYVWLQDDSTPGLGGHLYHALGETVPVIGVAKTRFASAGAAREVLRGGSQRPLFVTAVGLDVGDAARCVESMHGAFRVPTLLRRVDQLCRSS
jgi:deoxyribonuclease V